MKTILISKLSTAGGLLIGTIVASSLMIETSHSQTQTQPSAKRKFGPGQNIPRAVRPQGRQPVRKQQPKKPAAEIVSTHGKWAVQCDPKKKKGDAAAKEKRACAIVQTALHEKNKQIGLTLILAKVKQGKDTATMMRIMAPISVYLPTGVALEVDGKAAGRVPFTRCLPQTCMAFAQMRKETLATMKKGSKGKFLIYEAPGVGIPLNLDLSGFTAALDALDKTQQ